ncbi:MAG TPA: type II toxin-antitoxin system PemK/MazF family toxin [bacterium]|jgi:mRNA interferase MazF
MTKDFPRRGEIWLVNFNPGRGSEQKGIRPALIIQNDIGNQHAATTIVAAITSAIKIYPVTVHLPVKSVGLSKASMVNLAQLLTIDKLRLMKRIGNLPAELTGQVNEALKISLGI